MKPQRSYLLALCALSGLVVVVLAACGGSDSIEAKRSHCQSLTGQEHAECTAELRQEEGKPPLVSDEPESEPAPEEAGGPLEVVGTITMTDEEGTTFTDRYSIGPLIEGDQWPAPPPVLDNCNILSPSVAERSVFARGEISVSYTEGSFPELVAIAPEGTVATEGEDLYASVMAYKADDEWFCRQEGLPQWEIQPGETRSFPIWLVVGDILSNARPHVPPELYDGWYFRFVGPLPAIQGTATISGPGASTCDGIRNLYLYGRPGVC